MKKGILLGKLHGIPIRLHPSWFIIFILVAWSLAAGYFPLEYPNLSGATRWIIASFSSLVFALSVLAHELGHAYVALRIPIAVREVMLYIFGGIADIESEPGTPAQEFRLAIAGPLVNLVLGLAFWCAWFPLKDFPILAAPSLWLARMNLLLAGFNLIPGFPMDGGRVLRAAIWKINKDPYRAAGIATLSGKVIGYLIISAGVYILFIGNLFGGIWLTLMGWFLQDTASNAQMQSTILHALDGVQVRDVMLSNPPKIPWHTHIDQVMLARQLVKKTQLYLVTDNTGGYLRGILPMRRLESIPPNQWQQLTAQEVMIPRRSFTAVHPDLSLSDALQIMENARVIHAQVTEDDQFLGILTKDEILQYLRQRSTGGS